jgi:hypothetical protein
MATDKTLPVLELNVSEENEIGFKLRIEGSDKDIGTSKPSVRFVVTETSSGKGWIFSATKTDDGVAINVPVMKGIVTESNKYNGKLEVILGGRYFTPTEVDIEFIEPLKVEAAVVSSVSVKKKSDFNINNNSSNLLEESKAVPEELQELSIESEIDSIIVKESAPKQPTPKIQPAPIAKTIVQERIVPETTIKPITASKKNYAELNASEKEAVNKLFLEKCSGYNMDAKEVKRLMNEGTSYTKKRLSALLAISVKEYLGS